MTAIGCVKIFTGFGAGRPAGAMASGVRGGRAGPKSDDATEDAVSLAEEEAEMESILIWCHTARCGTEKRTRRALLRFG